MVKKILAGILCAATMITLSVGCSDSAAPGASTDPSAKITGNTGEVKLEKGDKYAVMTIKDYGDITIKLYPDAAPKGTQNFIDLANSGFYNGKTFHRVVADFMAQGGDPNGDGTGGSKETIKGEFSANGVENSLSHTRGVVSMARASDMDSASSQFFICYSDKDTFLDGQYAAFGMVTEGMDVVDDFLKVERTTGSDNEQSKPVTPITIVKAEMIDDDADGNHRVQFTMNF